MGNFVDRYLRVLDYQKDEIIQMMCYEICKFSLNDDKFLLYRPSQIGACSVILSINIFKKEETDINKESKDKSGKEPFLEPALENPKKFYLNTKIWNNPKVVS